MRYILLENQIPQHNLAVEEYLLKDSTDEIFMLWQNRDSVIIGRHQNTLAEIDLSYITENQIDVVRRLTGGGAVFHDIGNLNFTFIKNKLPGETEIDFKKFTQPIIDALNRLGVPATFSGRNDLTILGKKFSGNAMLFHDNRVLEHGTLLFSTQKSKLTNALKVDPFKFSDKAVKSIQNRVTNISEHLPEKMSVLTFKDYIMSSIMRLNHDSFIQNLTEEEEVVVSKLMVEKYNTWEWNFGQSPQYSIDRKIRTKGGTIQVMMNVQHGIIQDIKFFGDFFTNREIQELEQHLIGKLHNQNSILHFFEQENISSYFCNVTEKDLIQLLF